MTKKHIHFLLVVGDDFNKIKEDIEFKHRWHIDGNLAEKIHEALRKVGHMTGKALHALRTGNMHDKRVVGGAAFSFKYFGHGGIVACVCS